MEDIKSTSKKDRFPVGMIVILFLIALSLLMASFELAGNGTPSVLFISSGEFLGQFLNKIYLVVMTVILGLSFYGILRQKIWARKLTIGWYTFILGLSAFNVVYHLLNEWKTFNSYQGGQDIPLATAGIVLIFLLFATVITWAIGLTVIFYLKRKQDFFIN